MEAGMPTPPWPTNEPMDAIDRLRVDGQPVVRTYGTTTRRATSSATRSRTRTWLAKPRSPGGRRPGDGRSAWPLPSRAWKRRRRCADRRRRTETRTERHTQPACTGRGLPGLPDNRRPPPRRAHVMNLRHKRPPEPADREVLAGLVEHVGYHDPDNGFCMLRVKARGQRDLVTVVGRAAAVAAGERITASGQWVNHRTHGHQFKAHFLHSSAPASTEGIEKYLRSGMIRDIGQVYARKAGAGVRRQGARRHRDRARTASRGHRASARFAPGASPTRGPSRKRFARSWSSCTAMAWARRGRCGSSRPAGATRSRSSRRTLTASPATFAVSGSGSPTRSR